ncbi:MAG TPA: hypothetical protein VF327_13600 [Gaiellaceae bacterium]
MKGRPTGTPAGIERLCLLVAGSVSAGVHAGLAAEHLHEWPPLGAAFIAAAVLLSAAVAMYAIRPTDDRPPRALLLLLAGTIAAYASTRLLALPPLDPTREPLDALGLVTTAVETAGLILALRLGRRLSIRRLPLAIPSGGTR